MLNIGHALQAARLMQDKEFFQSVGPFRGTLSPANVGKICIEDEDGINDHFSWRVAATVLAEEGIPIKEKHFYTYHMMRCYGDFDEILQHGDEDEFVEEGKVTSTMDFFNHLFRFMVEFPKTVPIKDWM